jgi:hypothetical protein
MGYRATTALAGLLLAGCARRAEIERTTLVAMLLAAAVSSAGCVTPGKQAYKPSAADDPSNACFASLMVDKRFDVLRPKIAINVKPSELPLEMMADKSTPTAEEKQALGVWKIARDTCMAHGESFRQSYAPPAYRATLTSNVTRVHDLTAKLYAAEITYGEFNRARAGNAATAQEQLANVAQQEREQNAREEDRRRVAAGMALQNIQNQQLILQQQQHQQQLILQQSRPTNTNCSRIGNQVNCTTY